MIDWHSYPTTTTTQPYCPPTTTTTVPPTTTTTTVPPTTTTTTSPPATTTTTSSPATTTTTQPSGFAGISGGGENCGSGPTGSCSTGITTGAPAYAPTASVAPTPPLAFTGAPVGAEVGLGLALVAIGAVICFTVRRHLRHG